MLAIGGIFLNFPLRIFSWICTKLLAFIYRGPNDALPPVREDCVLISAGTLAARIRTGKITSKDAVQAFIRRIDEINAITNCVVANRFEEALHEAEQIDAIIAEGTKTTDQIAKDTPYLGVPFTVSGGTNLKGLPWTFGSLLKKKEIATTDAAIVKTMRNAGGIPLGITNSSEFMTGLDAHNKLYGRTKNPYHSQRATGGSSGGEAAVLAAAGSPIGIGSDKIGSITLSASSCGIFAHKTSPGIISEDEENQMLSVGPMSKFACDLRPMLKVLAQNSKIDLKLDERVDTSKLRYFYIDGGFCKSFLTPIKSPKPELREALKKVISYYKKTYGIEVKKIEFSELQFTERMWFARMKQGPQTADQLALRKCLVNCVKAFMGLSENTFDYHYFNLLKALHASPGSDDHKYFLDMALKFKESLEDLLKTDAVLFAPTQPTPPNFPRYSWFTYSNSSYATAFNITDSAVSQFPVMQTQDDLPIGIQVVASQYQDRLTIAVAEEMEKAFGGWKPPPSQVKW